MILKGMPFDTVSYDFVNSGDNSSSGRSEPVWNVTVLTQLNDDIFRRLIPAIVVLVAMMVLGVAGNVVIVYIFIRKMRKSSQNLLLLSLGVFDLVSSCVGVPSEIYDMRNYYFYQSSQACKAMRFLTTLPLLASILVLLVIAVDRYRKICKPLHHQIHLAHARIAIFIVIVVALIFSVPALFLYGHRTFPTPTAGVMGHDCSVDDAYRNSVLPIVYEGVFAAAFVLCTLVLVSLYLRIWMETRRHRKYMKTHASMGRIKLDEFIGSSVCLESSTDPTPEVHTLTSQASLSSKSPASSLRSLKKRWRSGRYNAKLRHTQVDQRVEPETTEPLPVKNVALENGGHGDGRNDPLVDTGTHEPVSDVVNTNSSPFMNRRQSAVTFELSPYPTESLDSTTEDFDSQNEIREFQTVDLDSQADNFDSSGENLDSSVKILNSKSGDLDCSKEILDSRSNNFDSSGENVESSAENFDSKTENLDAKADHQDSQIDIVNFPSDDSKSKEALPSTDEETELSSKKENLNGITSTANLENTTTPARESQESPEKDSAAIQNQRIQLRKPEVLRKPGRLLKTKSSQSLYYAARVKKALRATRMTVIACVITIGFILSYLPHLILIILRSVIVDFEHNFNDASLVLYNIFLRSYFVNTVLNIFVYGSMNLEFRSALVCVWKKIKSPFVRDSSQSEC
ncbi:uncharacterized protein LOC101847221 [Aplysia californica]|uniref:Uncharacterized protein LOC101847221 n=1 Tax=Aplysia californica TaxID=6500 RepID=A0ABM0K4V4_APLCA|nr:uncharacterized protein LOC101847221 [Aplysia californica]XP_012943733.1 uncharacterized protein LOC101847221 [Aplysia californica]